MKILCEAVSFGFGPVGKLLAIAEKLYKDFELDFIGNGSSLELAKKSVFFSKFIEIDTTTDNSVIPNDVIDNYDFALSVINPVFGEKILRRGKKLIVIDSLFYMWKSIPQVWKECDLLIIQSFNGEAERLKVEPIPNAHIVGPIISSFSVKNDNAPKNQVILNFGGADYPYIKNDTIIPEFVESIISNLGALKMYSEKHVAIGPRYLEKLVSLEKYGYKIGTYSHEEFMGLIKSSDMVLTIPGLTTTFESFSSSIPTLFLPPMNYSQLLNLQKLQQYGVADFSFNWDAFYEVPFQILEENKGVEMVESFLTRSIYDNKIQKALNEKLEMLLNSENEMKIISRRQNKFLKTVGNEGASAAKNLIKDFIYG